MKLLIASDIHGDAVCCRQMLQLAEQEKVDKILLLGDLLYHGPRNDLPAGYAPKQVIELLNEKAEKLICVRGNCEAEVDQMVLCFPVMSTTAAVYDSQADLTLFMSHGHVYGPESLPPLGKRTVFLSGHTHLQGLTMAGDIPCLNPGSVSLPKGGNPRSCALYEAGNFKILSLEGEILGKFAF